MAKVYRVLCSVLMWVQHWESSVSPPWPCQQVPHYAAAPLRGAAAEPAVLAESPPALMRAATAFGSRARESRAAGLVDPPSLVSFWAASHHDGYLGTAGDTKLRAAAKGLLD